MRQPLQPANGASSATDTVERVQLLDASGVVVSGTTGTPADSFASPGAIPEHMAFPELFNGTTWDRQRANTEGILLASAARTLQTFSPTQTNHNAKGVAVGIEVTAKAAATTLTAYIYEVDPITGNRLYIASTAVWAAAVLARAYLVVYPGILAADYASAGGSTPYARSAALPRSWGFQVDPGDASSVTYSASFAYIL